MPRSIFNLCTHCLLLSLTVGRAVAQANAVLPVHEGVPQDIYATSPAMELIAKQPGAHPGKIWLRSTADGLHIWGKVQVEDNDLHWPRQKSEVLSSDHVEVWLATATDIAMPPVGWGNQFGPEELAGVKDCDSQNDSHTGDAAIGTRNCVRWYNEQIAYREQLKRLFVRQWLIAGNEYHGPGSHLFEDFASTAYSNLKAGFFDADLPSLLEPKNNDGEPKTKDGVLAEVSGLAEKQITKHDAAGNSYQLGVTTGYTFHLFVPYSAFPPTQKLQMKDLRVMVDVFAAAPEGKKQGAFSSTSATRKWGDPKTFNQVRLEAPPSYTVSPCKYPLQQTDLEGIAHGAWIQPVSAAKYPVALASDFDLGNPAAGYMYDPGGVSPEVAENRFFWKQMQDGAFLCGPRLTYRKGDTVQTTNFSVSQQYFGVKPLPDGWSLVRSGPDMSTQSRFGSGACGSCPVMSFNIYAVSPNGIIVQALALEDEYAGYSGQPGDGDLAIASDWKRITYYLETEPDADSPPGTEGSWSSTDYCLEGHTYKECGKHAKVKPPEPRNFKDMSGDN